MIARYKQVLCCNGKLSILLLPIILIGDEVKEGKPRDLTP